MYYLLLAFSEKLKSICADCDFIKSANAISKALNEKMN